MTPHRRTPFLFDAVFCVLRRFKPEVVLGYPSGFFASSGRLRGRQRGCEGSRVISLRSMVLARSLALTRVWHSVAAAPSGLGTQWVMGVGLTAWHTKLAHEAFFFVCQRNPRFAGFSASSRKVGTRKILLRVPRRPFVCQNHLRVPECQAALSPCRPLSRKKYFHLFFPSFMSGKRRKTGL